MNAKEAAQRLLNDGELVYVSGPTRQELAELVIDDELPRGAVRVRDVAGLVVTSVVRVRKPEFDREHERSRMFNV
jgi:anaerobic selenocysteine-containing dehydrogenase